MVVKYHFSARIHAQGAVNSHLHSLMHSVIKLDFRFRWAIHRLQLHPKICVHSSACFSSIIIFRVFGAFEYTNNREAVYAWFTISHWLIYANSAANPIVYNFLSGKLKNVLACSVLQTLTPSTGHNSASQSKLFAIPSVTVAIMKVLYFKASLLEFFRRVPMYYFQYSLLIILWTF